MVFLVGNLVHVVQNGDAPFVPECLLLEIVAFTEAVAGLMAEVVDVGSLPGCPRLTFWVFVHRLRHANKQEWDKEEI
jgi:hypothetical protein